MSTRRVCSSRAAYPKYPCITKKRLFLSNQCIQRVCQKRDRTAMRIRRDTSSLQDPKNILSTGYGYHPPDSTSRKRTKTKRYIYWIRSRTNIHRLHRLFAANQMEPKIITLPYPIISLRPFEYNRFIFLTIFSLDNFSYLSFFKQRSSNTIRCVIALHALQ